MALNYLSFFILSSSFVIIFDINHKNIENQCADKGEESEKFATNPERKNENKIGSHNWQ